MGFIKSHVTLSVSWNDVAHVYASMTKHLKYVTLNYAAVDIVIVVVNQNAFAAYLF